MRIMVICDLHYDKRIYKGFDEGRAWEWLLSIVDYHSPEYLLSCGDWGHTVNEAEFYELLRRTVVLTIYGNHENMDVLTRLYNIRAKEYLPVLMDDGRVYDIGGLRVTGISGIISTGRRQRKGVPRRKPEEFLEIARRLADQEIDILLIHETPYLPNLFPFMVEGIGSKTALEAIKIIRPMLVINGHMHSGGFKTHELPWGSKYIYIDSSQQNRHYIIINNIEIEIWRDLEKLETIQLQRTTASKTRAENV
ncbi:metallophosphoesterase [Desulfurococcaceae archaeon AG1]|nr:metallophosphoesterase [Desulfurococcaceae archaeon AG1]